MVYKDAASFGVTAETVEKKATCAVSYLDSHIFLPSSAPLGLRTTLYTPDKSTQAEKKSQGTKALYVMLSSGIDFFICLTDNIKSLLHVMSS